jgi:hypothetical protein
MSNLRERIKALKPPKKEGRRAIVEPQEGMTGFELAKLVSEIDCDCWDAVNRLARTPADPKKRVSAKCKKAVLRALADRYPNIWPSVDDIAEKSGYSPTQSRAALRELEFHDRLIYEILHHGERNRGGIGQTKQYWFNVDGLISFLEQQKGLKGGKTEPEPLAYPSDSEPNPTGAVTNPTGAVGEKNIEQNKEENREERELQKPSHSLSSSSQGEGKEAESETRPLSGQEIGRLEELAVATIVSIRPNATLYRKDRQELRQVITDSQATAEELKAAVIAIIDPLDDFESRHLGNILCSKLGGMIAAQRARLAQKKAEDESHRNFERATNWISKMCEVSREDSLNGAERGTPEWEVQLDAWLRANPPPEPWLILPSATEQVEEAKAQARKHREEEWQRQHWDRI